MNPRQWLWLSNLLFRLQLLLVIYGCFGLSVMLCNSHPGRSVAMLVFSVVLSLGYTYLELTDAYDEA